MLQGVVLNYSCKEGTILGIWELDEDFVISDREVSMQKSYAESVQHVVFLQHLP